MLNSKNNALSKFAAAQTQPVNLAAPLAGPCRNSEPRPTVESCESRFLALAVRSLTVLKIGLILMVRADLERR
jgi:hypothetical protein